MKKIIYLIIINAMMITSTVAGATKQNVINARKKLLNQGVEEIVFCTRAPHKNYHWYENFGYFSDNVNRKVYVEGGGLYKYNLKNNTVTTLIDAKKGTIRDPQVHYDGEKIIFSYRKDGSEVFHLYEINCDGSNLKQLTDGIYDDIEPSYFPDGSIVFISGRGKRWVNCWISQVGTLLRCDADGTNIRELSANVEHDNTPYPLPDGRILYTRWEYVDRSQTAFHHLWTANPDGTNQQIFFGNQVSIPRCVLIDAKPLPKSDKILAIMSPNHGRPEHTGRLVIISTAEGVDNKKGIKRITNYFVRDPHPVTDKFYIATKNEYGKNIVVIDENGNYEMLYELPKNLKMVIHEPRPIVKRKREIAVPDRVDLNNPNGTLILMDVYEGRNMKNVKRGSIKKLLVTETLPKPINFTGSMEPVSWGGTFTLMRILGTVPVDEDGSAKFIVPANRSIVLTALDKDGRAVKKMHSFLTVMPGENLSCIGCHEERNQAPTHIKFPNAVRRQASVIKPINDMPEVFNYPTDIQPIWDKNCVSCHNAEKKSGGVDLTGDLGPMFSQSYYWLSVLRQFGDARNRYCGNFKPYSMYDCVAPLMNKISKKHHNVKLDSNEIRKIRLWLQVGAPYLGSYAGLGTGMIGGDYFDHLIDREDLLLDSVQKAQVVINKNCSACHHTRIHSKTPKLRGRRRDLLKYYDKEFLKKYWHLSNLRRFPSTSKDHRVFRKLPTSPSDQTDMRAEHISYQKWRYPYTRHALYNFSFPEKSSILTAALAKSAGGRAVCKKITKDGKVMKQSHVIFKSKNDPRYKIILKSIKDVAQLLNTKKRWHMKGFKPDPAYIREMIRYGVLPKDYDVNNPKLTPYEIDQLYWRSLWYIPGKKY